MLFFLFFEQIKMRLTLITVNPPTQDVKEKKHQPIFTMSGCYRNGTQIQKTAELNYINKPIHGSGCFHQSCKL